jgi:hypothetical protein
MPYHHTEGNCLLHISSFSVSNKIFCILHKGITSTYGRYKNIFGKVRDLCKKGLFLLISCLLSRIRIANVDLDPDPRETNQWGSCSGFGAMGYIIKYFCCAGICAAEVQGLRPVRRGEGGEALHDRPGGL